VARIAVGTTVGSYEVLSLLGKGGMGEVYLALDARLNRRVAIKLLAAEFTVDRDRVRRLEQEAHAVSALNHPNIITIYDIGQSASGDFIATEFIEGQTLRQKITAARLGMPAALEIGVQVAAALAAAHAGGILHRDIKPENIMVRPDGLVKVLDFGLAKFTGSSSATVDSEALTSVETPTRTGVVLGTAKYMSPEQARGQNLDARTDVFSLGVVLYEMLTGHAPFAGATTADIVAALLEREPLPLDRFNPEAPEELKRILAKALRKDREERYQTIRDLLIDLKDLKQESALKSKAQETAQTNAEAAMRAGSGARHVLSEIRHHRLGIGLAFLMVAALVAVGYFERFSGSGQAIESLAVLPFVNVGADPNTEYLSDGITDSLIDGLSQIPRLKVMSRNSVFQYKASGSDAQKAGLTLGVRAVLTGKVTQHGNDLLISAELVDVHDNSHLWGEQYNRKLSDILSIQAELSRSISENLRLRLSGEDKQRLTKRSSENPEAYDLYLKGRYYLNGQTPGGDKKSLDYFQRAIDVDPNYGAAYAGLAEYYAALTYASTTSSVPPRDAFLKANAAALKAVELDDTLAEAHTSLAMIATLWEWDWNGAEREFKRAIALNPNYVDARHSYSHLLVDMGRFEESLAQSQRALALDPLDVGMNFHLGFHYYNARQYDQAKTQLQKTIGMDSKFPEAHSILGLVYEQQGLYSKAVAEIERSVELSGSDQRGSLGHLYAISGRRDDAQRLIDQLQEESKRQFVSPYYIAKIYAGLGEKSQAFAWLEKAYTERDSNIVSLKVDAEFDSLRPDPRFTDLLRRMGFPQ
jgi:serine/threonine-protein kinase